MTEETQGSTETREDALLEGMARIESAILQLVEVVQTLATRAPALTQAAPAPAAPRTTGARTRTGAGGPAPASAAAAPSEGAAGPNEPPLIRVAPPAARPTPPPADPAARPDEVASYYDPYADRTDLYVPPPEASIEEVLTRVFEAALMESAEDTWALMTKLTHSSQLRGPRALDHFKAFAWHKTRRTASDYLDANLAPDSYAISYTEPAEVTADTDRVKLFVKKFDGRMPAPISLARDPKHNGAWRVAMISL